MKIVRDSESSSYRIGVSIGIALKGPVKRVRHNGILTVGCIEFDLSSIRDIESQLYIKSQIYEIEKIKGYKVDLH